MCPCVFGTLLSRRPHNVLGIIRIHTILKTIFQCFFHYSVLTGMECQDCCSPARFQCTRKLLHKFIENLIFMIDIYSQCLKDALAGFLNRVFALLLRYKRKCIFYYFTKFKSRIYSVPLTNFIRYCLCNFVTVRLIRVLI